MNGVLTGLQADDGALYCQNEYNEVNQRGKYGVLSPQKRLIH